MMTKEIHAKTYIDLIRPRTDFSEEAQKKYELDVSLLVNLFKHWEEEGKKEKKI